MPVVFSSELVTAVGLAGLGVDLVVRASQSFSLVLGGGGVSHNSPGAPIYDDGLHGIPTAVLRGLRPGLVASAGLVAETERVNCGGGSVIVEAIDPSKLTHDGEVDVMALAPVLEALQVAIPAIQNPVYVAGADHVA